MHRFLPVGVEELANVESTVDEDGIMPYDKLVKTHGYEISIDNDKDLIQVYKDETLLHKQRINAYSTITEVERGFYLGE